MFFDVVKSLSKHLVAFRADEDGAVTVDFVVLTSSVVLLGAAHAVDVANATNGIADNIDACLGTDIASIVVEGNPENYIQNLEAAGAACSSR